LTRAGPPGAVGGEVIKNLFEARFQITVQRPAGVTTTSSSAISTL
jgi:hypothetical protein